MKNFLILIFLLPILAYAQQKPVVPINNPYYFTTYAKAKDSISAPIIRMGSDTATTIKTIRDTAISINYRIAALQIGGGVTPTDGLLKWDADSTAYWLYPDYQSAKKGGFYLDEDSEDFKANGIGLKDTSLILRQVPEYYDPVNDDFVSNVPLFIKGQNMVNYPALAIMGGYFYVEGPGINIWHNATGRTNSIYSQDTTGLNIWTQNGSINATIGWYNGDRVDFLKTGAIKQYSSGSKVFSTDASGNIYSQNKLIKVDSSEFETHRIKLNYNFATDGVGTAKVIEKQIPLGSIIKYIIIREDTTLTSTSGTSALAVYLGSSGEETICTKIADNNNSTDWINSQSESGTYHWGNIPFNEDLRILIPADITGGTVTFYIEYIFNP